MKNIFSQICFFIFYRLFLIPLTPSYSKLCRFFEIKQRIVAKDLLKTVNDMFERLNEISNLLPEGIVQDLKKSTKRIERLLVRK